MEYPANSKEVVQRIIQNVKAGYKVMVIMRGPPGCGKSHLAKNIVKKSTPGCRYKSHIFSIDNYFINPNGQYVFEEARLGEAHQYNRQCVQKNAADGWSPIIVDNSNMRIWQMVPYARTAIQYGYMIELLIPYNNWCSSINRLADKNLHGISKSKIRQILERFEVATVDGLIEACGKSYKVKLPQKRLKPLLPNQSPSQSSSNRHDTENVRKAVSELRI